MPAISSDRETAAETAIRSFVLNEARLAIYDPLKSQRPRVPVASFEIELLEFDEQDPVAHAAGPVVLRGPRGDVEQFLRISLPIRFDGEICLIADPSAIRAAYIVPTEDPNGACKETAALANA